MPLDWHFVHFLPEGLYIKGLVCFFLSFLFNEKVSVSYVMVGIVLLMELMS